jgi:hypothetical protein
MARMIDRLGRRLRVAFLPPSADPSSPEADPPASLDPEVELVAYAEECILSGRVRLSADRLTDMLEAHDEILLVDVLVERLADGGAVEVPEILVPRDELLVVQVSGPRGDPAIRRRTRMHPVGMQVGPYEVRGLVHAPPLSDPLVAIRRRPVVVPLTDASLAFAAADAIQRRRAGAIAVNRRRIDLVVPVSDVEILAPDRPLAVERGLRI